MRIFVTGGAGYIGSHACKALAAAGHEPIVYDNLAHGHRRAVKWGPLITGDVLDQQQLRAALDAHRPEAVIRRFWSAVPIGREKCWAGRRNTLTWKRLWPRPGDGISVLGNGADLAGRCFQSPPKNRYSHQ